jgi:uncharacterized protein (TIGR02145 family)
MNKVTYFFELLLNKKVKLSSVLLLTLGMFGLQPQTVKDIEGNVYKTVTIGKQVWMKENLKTSKYNDGKAIPLVTDNIAWSDLSTPAYCWNNNDATTNKNTYGALYNWYTVNTNKLCPRGWHVPTDAEWRTLTTYLGGESVAGGKLKETGTIHWERPNTGAVNSSGFTAHAGGGRYEDGRFHYLGSKGYWWSSTEEGEASVWCFELQYALKGINRVGSKKSFGLSIRCLRNN